MGDKAAARSFYATITLPAGLFSNVSANVTDYSAFFFYLLGCVVERF